MCSVCSKHTTTKQKNLFCHVRLFVTNKCMIEMCRLLTSRHQKVTHVILTLDAMRLHARSNHTGRQRYNLLCFLKNVGIVPLTVNSRNGLDKCGIQHKLSQRALASHAIAYNDDKKLPSASSMKNLTFDASSSFAERYQLERIRTQKPSNRFANNRSFQEWPQLHCEIMQMNSLKAMDIIDAEQCMRWWISQSRSCVQISRNERTRKRRFNSRRKNDDAHTTIISQTQLNNAAKAVVSSLDLYGRVVSAIEERPELLLVDEMYHWYDGYLPRATHLLNAILDAWRLCWINLDHDNIYLFSPQAILTLLKDSWSDRVPMNERTYSIVMDAAVATMSPICDTVAQHEIPIFCEDILNFMLDINLPKNMSEHARPLNSEYSSLPDNVAYTTALNAWARSGRTDAAERAEMLFKKFTVLCSNGTLPTMPNTYCYNTLLIALCRPPTAFVNLRSILLKKAKNQEQTFDQSMVDNVLCRENILLLAEETFRSMQHCANPDVMPNTVSFRTLIFAWAEYSVDLRYVDWRKSRRAMDRAVALLYEMVRLRVDSGNTAIDIDYIFFGKVISTLALNQPKAMDDFARSDLHLAEEVYHYMLNLYRKTRDERFAPDTTLLCAMTIVYAKDGRPLDAEALLTRLENEARSRNQPSELPRISYYCDTLDACMQQAMKEMKSGKQDSACLAADKAESLIIRMIDIAYITGKENNVPDRRTIHNMLHLWILCQTPQRAEKFYRCIESRHEATQCQNLVWKPFHLRMLLSAWASKGNDSPIYSAQQADNILKEMQQKYEQSHDAGFRPKVTSISHVISAWLRTEHKEKVAKCKRLVDEAVAAYGDGNVQARPDTALYGSLLKAFSQVGDGQSAMDLLEKMKNDYIINSNHSAKPTIGIFNMVLLSWLKSADVDAPKHALHVFKMMQASDVADVDGKTLAIEPDYRTFSLLCEILAKTKGPKFEEEYNFFLQRRNQFRKTDGVEKT